jgi:ribosomal protein S18 acetylase RimI-like enzyme
MAGRLKIRLASQHDLEALVRLEAAAFRTDRFSRDQLDYLLTRSRATVFILEHEGSVAGAAYLLWRRPLRHGRLYNIAIAPVFQGRGYGARLIRECEIEAARRGCERLVLEVRTDNGAAVGFYEKHGYKIAAILPDYYEDGTPGLKMSKNLRRYPGGSVRLRVPYYAQTFDFTCGPACIMMALKYHRPETEFTRALELSIWKEGTLIFMTSGVGGTGPYGLALAAARRGLQTRLISSSDKAPFISSVRSRKKREAIDLVHHDMKRQAMACGVAASFYEFTLEDILAALHRGMLPIALISTYRLTGDRVPHWVMITGITKSYIYIHDPDERSYGQFKGGGRHLKISHGEFVRMSRYGREAFRCLILIGSQI